MSGPTNFRKPLNMIQGPVYPDIRQGPPRFRSAGKSWKVDAGRTMIETGNYTEELYGHAVLVQSRDYNKTVYGQSSHRDVVNKSFRPPPRSPYFDDMPLSRIPATANGPIIPRNNPGTTSSDGGSVYRARNDVLPGYAVIKHRLRDSLNPAASSGQVYQYRAVPEIGVPDLEEKISASADSGRHYSHRTFISEMAAPVELEEVNPGISVVAQDSGRSLGPTVYDATPIMRDSRHQDYSLSASTKMNLGITPGPVGNPKVIEKISASANAGMAPMELGGPSEFYSPKIVEKPDASVDAGFQHSYRTQEYYEYAGKQVEKPDASADAGFNPGVRFYSDSPDVARQQSSLQERVSASANAGYNPKLKREQTRMANGPGELMQVRGYTPGVTYSEYHYREDNSKGEHSRFKHADHTNISITATPDYQIKAEGKYNPHFRQRAEGTAHAQLSQVSGPRPFYGVRDNSHLARNAIKT